MSTPSAIAAAGPAAAPSAAAAREIRVIVLLVAGVIAVGGALQIFIPPGPVALVAASAIAGVTVFVLSLVVPGRLKATLVSFRFVSVLLLALAICAILGTLILQGKSEELYRQKYGPVAGEIIIRLRLDDIFHSLWFAGLIALFAAAVIVSGVLRWPVRLRNAGFFTCHVGLITSLVGAALSTTMSVKGRVDLHAGGETASKVMVTQAGVPTGRFVPLGFDLRLDRFDVVHYNAEYRVAFYQRNERGWPLKASFDPDVGVRHRLPGGDSFVVKAFYPDFVPLSEPIVVPNDGAPALRVHVAGSDRWLFPGDRVDTPDGLLAVIFDRSRPAPPMVQTAVLVSAGDRSVLVHRADHDESFALQDGLELAGGLVRFGAMLPSARAKVTYASASNELRNPAIVLEVKHDGELNESLLVAREGGGLRISLDGALAFERREDEVKAFRSAVTAIAPGQKKQSLVSVNDPFSFGGWTLYQANYNPEDPTYSGLDAVRDPGVAWVFLGFALIASGVFYMFYIETRLRRRREA